MAYPASSIAVNYGGGHECIADQHSKLVRGVGFEHPEVAVLGSANTGRLSLDMFSSFSLTSFTQETVMARLLKIRMIPHTIMRLGMAAWSLELLHTASINQRTYAHSNTVLAHETHTLFQTSTLTIG